MSNTPSPTAADLCAFLQARFPLPPGEAEDVPALWRVPPPPQADVQENNARIRRLTLALDFRALDITFQAGRIFYQSGDALFLHRPFDLPPDFWPHALVFAAHRKMDAHLSVGWNPTLFQTLHLSNQTDLRREETDIHPIGMVGDLPVPISFGDLLRYLFNTFGGMETALINGRETVSRLAVMGAMTPGLVKKADEAGAQGYLTGQVRDVARSEAALRKLAVFATGHNRAEWWGLRQLAYELRNAFPPLETRVIM